MNVVCCSRDWRFKSQRKQNAAFSEALLQVSFNDDHILQYQTPVSFKRLNMNITPKNWY